MRVIESFGIFSKRFNRPKDEGEIWHIFIPNPIDGSVRAKLEKLGMDDRMIKELYKHYYSFTNMDEINTVAIIMDEGSGTYLRHYNWQFSSFHDIDSDVRSKGFTSTEYTDKGEVTLTAEEEEDWRLRDAANKYNL